MNRVVPIVLGLVVVILLIGRMKGEDCSMESAEYDAALVQAREEGKYLFIAFTGSEWCDWCIKFNKEVAASPVFQNFARSNLVMMVLDLPSKPCDTDEGCRKQKQFARCFNVDSYPTMFLINPDGAIIAKTGYKDGGAEAYVEHLKELIGSSK